MRKRLKDKAAKKRDFDRLRQLILYIVSKGDISGETKEECLLKIRLILFRADFSCYEKTGKPLLGGGFFWIKETDGPDLAWKRGQAGSAGQLRAAR